ncbi:DUF5683 domain-containing protein [Flavobacterium cellulosilyticum]|uniref:DUF5683 domain-containing protein n=1 Tax=Flavobacterium cellulosilyticum TaxID=2541731 RepID=A0A4R5C8U3_9FLAO|nr:DUF5683 domain-containing protein [Flavobacterium cellulosilyticum]TDD95209.1 hypothetical protein E0F76_14285 [Flavobacterium cellulosilyticum]
MNKFAFIGLFLFVLGNISVFSQGKIGKEFVAQDTLKSVDIDPLTPAKAAFYSAILPGLGQAYNKKYWKIPLVYGAIGTSMYFYLDSNKKYNQYRDAYKRRLEGYSDDNFSYLDNSRLIAGQKFYKKNKDFSALFVIGFYVLNIIDANVDAALIQFNVNDNLSLKPNMYYNDVTLKSNLGLTLNYNF